MFPISYIASVDLLHSMKSTHLSVSSSQTALPSVFRAVWSMRSFRSMFPIFYMTFFVSRVLQSCYEYKMGMPRSLLLFFLRYNKHILHSSILHSKTLILRTTNTRTTSPRPFGLHIRRPRTQHRRTQLSLKPTHPQHPHTQVFATAFTHSAPIHSFLKQHRSYYPISPNLSRHVFSFWHSGSPKHSSEYSTKYPRPRQFPE